MLPNQPVITMSIAFINIIETREETTNTAKLFLLLRLKLFNFPIIYMK